MWNKKKKKDIYWIKTKNLADGYKKVIEELISTTDDISNDIEPMMNDSSITIRVTSKKERNFNLEEVDSSTLHRIITPKIIKNIPRYFLSSLFRMVEIILEISG